MANIDIYHEKQSKMLCALHCLNNLFQNPNEFSTSDLNAICTKYEISLK